MKYYVIEQGRAKHFGLAGSYTEKLNNLPAIIACTDSYQKYIGEEFHVDGIVYADGTYLFGRSTHLTKVQGLREATEEEVKRFTEVAASLNLHYATLVHEHKDLFGKVHKSSYEALDYIDRDKMRFKLNGEIVGWKEVLAYEPPTGLHFAYFHDNGYSYIGVDPTTKDSWVKSVKAIKKVFYGNLHGIVSLENGVIEVRQCKERYSEVSNT